MAYTSNTLLKTYLGISGSGDDTLLTTLITRAQAAIDTYTRRTFEGSASNKTFDAVEDVRGRYLYVRRAGDLASITSITNGDGNTVSSSDYVTEPRNEAPYFAIKLKRNATVSWTYSGTPEDAITVNGVWAYSATAPDDIVAACTEIAALYFRLRDTTSDLGRTVVTPTATILPMGLSQMTKRTLDSYRRLI